MGAINEYSGSGFPGAAATLETDLGAGDCVVHDTFEELVTFLQTSGGTACTIRFGRAFTNATVAELVTICTVP